MKRNVLVFGLISGLIVSILMGISMAIFGCGSSTPNYDVAMVVGYTSMLIAFSLIFVGVKNYRDKYNGGVITFGKAFKLGLYIMLIASTMYALTWLIEYYTLYPNFMDDYAAHMVKNIPPDKLESEMKEINQMKELYKNPLFVILFSYVEIVPVGLIVTLICALILKRKVKKVVA